MGSWFEMIAASVGNNPIIQDVEFPHTPSIEMLLREEMIEYGFITDLNIANSSSDAADLGSFGDRPRVVAMGNPSHRSVSNAVYAGNLEGLELNNRSSRFADN